MLKWIDSEVFKPPESINLLWCLCHPMEMESGKVVWDQIGVREGMYRGNGRVLWVGGETHIPTEKDGGRRKVYWARFNLPDGVR